MTEILGQVLTQYGLPVALCVVVMAAEGFFLWKLWERNQTLFDRLLAAEKKVDGDDEEDRLAREHLDGAVNQLQQTIAANIDSLLETLHLALNDGDEREVKRLLADIERLRQDVHREREANTILHEKRFADVRALHQEQIDTMRTATQSIEKLSAMLQGAMRRSEP